MGDVGDFWRGVEAARKAHKVSRTEQAMVDIETLSRVQGVDLELHSSVHVTFTYGRRVVDFYPTTGKWVGRKPIRNGYGIIGAASYLGLRWGPIERAADLTAEQEGDIE